MLSVLKSETRLIGGIPGDTPNVTTSACGEVTAYTVRARGGDSFLDPDRGVITTLSIPDEIEGYMAVVRYSPFWCRPQFGDDFGAMPENTQALLWKKKTGGYGYILPMCSGEYVTSLCGIGGKLCAVTFSSYDRLNTCDAHAFVYGEGEIPYELMQNCAAEAARLLNNGLRLRSERRYPELFEYLGWCTWDAMEIWVNEEETLQKCREFSEKSIPVRWAILDDMWADVAWTQKLPKFTPHEISFDVMHSSTLKDYEADTVRFPSGLAGCIQKMKEEFGLSVGIWHTACGYWTGLHPGEGADRKLSGTTMITHEDRIMPDLRETGKAYQFFNTMHTYFRRSGADFVKVDNQSFVRAAYRNDIPVSIAAKNLHAAVDGSVGANFDGNLINCMCMATENMMNRPNSAICRCSDDFQPENREWFSKHVMQCAYNGLVQGQYYYNDWDMWWSDDGQAVKNSVLRAISGGPIYVSDRLGRSRAEIFLPLCFSDGRILRPDNVAVPAEDCLITNMAETARPMKVFNMAGETGYMAVFNLLTDGTSAVGTVAASEIPTLCCERFVMYEFFSGEWKVVTNEEKTEITLRDADDFRLYSFTPIESGTAVIGDASKFISIRAVTDHARGFVRLYEGGILKIYSEKPITYAENECGHPLKITADGNMYTIDAFCTREVYFG